MSECRVVRENMPLLVTESLDRSQRELSHEHIESCPGCSQEWKAYRETWGALGTLPELAPPPALRSRFLETIGQLPRTAQVIPFHRRPAFRWVAQAAAVVILAGGGYFAGNRTAPVRVLPTPASIASVQPASYSIAESRALPASALSPDIQGRPNIDNVQLVDADASDDKVSLAFDVTSRVTVTGRPNDKSMVRLVSYMLENQNSTTAPTRSRTIEWARQTYSNPSFADPEIAEAMAKVLRNDTHEGMRIRAVESLKSLPASESGDTRQALIYALNNDPNPAVRMKAVEALANMARTGNSFDSATVDSLRAKATQGDENPYIRVKAAEALSSIHPR